jgi:hypothetical protein
MMTPTAPFNVIKVVDTRDFIEIDDRFVALAGSGDSRPCDRCDRLHEIHAHVVDANGIGWIVGTGCMDAEANDVARKAARKATNEAKKAARRARAEALVAELAAAEAAVAAMTFPADRVEYEIEETRNGIAVRGFHRWEVDGAWAKLAAYDDADGSFSGHLDARTIAERLGCVETNWRRDRLHEILPRETVNKARRESYWLERNPA